MFYPFLLLVFVSATFSADPCKSTDTYSSWMGDIQDISVKNSVDSALPNYAWANQPLNNLLFGGSHDAGLHTITKKSFLATGFGNEYFITQSRSMQQQMCAGSRWFDVRFSYVGGQFLIYHGASGVVGYGRDLNTEVNEVLEFLQTPKYSREVIFWRVQADQNTEECFTRLLNLFRGHMVYNSENISLSQFTLNQIWNQNSSVGHIVIMGYKSALPATKPNETIWSYTTEQEGSFSDAFTLKGLIMKCGKGQQLRLLSYKQKYNTSQTKPLFGLWWTFTGEDVSANTHEIWRNFPNSLSDFFTYNAGEIGNFLLIDFFGDFPSVMEIVMEYNTNKYASFVPVSPVRNRTILGNPTTPGLSSNSSFCMAPSEDDATAKFTSSVITTVVGIGVAVVVVVVVLVVGVVLIVRKWKAER